MTHVVLCAHGTDNRAGRATTVEIREKVAARLPRLTVRDAYVDVQTPVIDDVLADVPDEPVIVVPLLLCTGYHMQVDIAQAVAAHRQAVSAGSLGPDPLLTTLLVRRLTEAGASPGEAVILAAAGSSREEGTKDARAAADMLAGAWGGPVVAAFGSAARPRVTEAVDDAHTSGSRAVIVSYLLGNGFFHDRLTGAGADVVTEPLGADELVVSAVLRRYEQAQRALAQPV